MRDKLARLRNLSFNKKKLASIAIGVILGIPVLLSHPSLTGVVARILLYIGSAYASIQTYYMAKRRDLRQAALYSFMLIWCGLVILVMSQGSLSIGGKYVAEENPVTGECKLMHTGEGIPWYYQDCSQEKLENICPEKVENMIEFLNTDVDIENKSHQMEYVESRRKASKWIEICREKGYTENHTQP